MTDPADPGRAERPTPDAHGQAALLLVESLIHGLAERRILTIRDGLEIMEIALSAQQAITEDRLQPDEPTKHAAVLLKSLIASLEADASD